MKLIIFLLFLIVNLHAEDMSDQRGMTNLLEMRHGLDAQMKCHQVILESELSYIRSGTMPKSPFAGEYKPKYLPSYGMPGSKQFYTMVF